MAYRPICCHVVSRHVFVKKCTHICCMHAPKAQVIMPDGSTTTFYTILCGVKGDWPYLRVSEAFSMHDHACAQMSCTYHACHVMWAGKAFHEWSLLTHACGVSWYRQVNVILWSQALQVWESAITANRLTLWCILVFFAFPCTCECCPPFMHVQCCFHGACSCTNIHACSGLAWYEDYCTVETGKARWWEPSSGPCSTSTCTSRRRSLWKPAGPNAHMAPWNRQGVCS